MRCISIHFRPSIHPCTDSFLLPRTNPVFAKFETKDSLETDGLWDVYNNIAMGNCSETVAEKYGITRESMDACAIDSYKRAERAWKEGIFNNEIAPVTVKGKKGDTIVKEDEEYKKVIYEKIPSLKSAFKPGGSITAANSSSLNDGASALILMSAEKAKELGVNPLAKVVCMFGLIHLSTNKSLIPGKTAYADAGVDPVDFPVAPTIALPQALKKANLTIDDIARFEINEAFAIVVCLAQKLLQIDHAKINVDG